MKKYRFEARIEAGDGGGAYVLFPFDVAAEFGTRAKVPVKATLDGVPYTGSLIKYGHPQHMLPVLKEIRRQIQKGPGDTLSAVVWKDEAERVLEVPAEFKELLNKEKLLGSFQKLSYTYRREYCRWVTEAKREETRKNRLQKAIELLKAGVRTPG